MVKCLLDVAGADLGRSDVASTAAAADVHALLTPLKPPPPLRRRLCLAAFFWRPCVVGVRFVCVQRRDGLIFRIQRTIQPSIGPSRRRGPSRTECHGNGRAESSRCRVRPFSFKDSTHPTHTHTHRHTHTRTHRHNRASGTPDEAKWRPAMMNHFTSTKCFKTASTRSPTNKVTGNRGPDDGTNSGSAVCPCGPPPPHRPALCLGCRRRAFFPSFTLPPVTEQVPGLPLTPQTLRPGNVSDGRGPRLRPVGEPSASGEPVEGVVLAVIRDCRSVSSNSPSGSTLSEYLCGVARSDPRALMGQF